MSLLLSQVVGSNPGPSFGFDGQDFRVIGIWIGFGVRDEHGVASSVVYRFIHLEMISHFQIFERDTIPSFRIFVQFKN